MASTIDIKDINFRPITEEDKTYITNQRIAEKRNRLISRAVISAVIFAAATIFEVVARILMNREYDYELYKISPAVIFFIIMFVLFNVVSVVVFFLQTKLESLAGDISVADCTITKAFGRYEVYTEAKNSYEKRVEIHKEELRRNAKIRSEWMEEAKKIRESLEKMKKDAGKDENKLKEYRKAFEDFHHRDLAVKKETLPGPRPKFRKYGNYDDVSSVPEFLFFSCDQGDCQTGLKIDNHRHFRKFKAGDKVMLVRFCINDITTYTVYK